MWLKKLFNDWKAEFNIVQKEKQYYNGLKSAPDLNSLLPVIEGDEINVSHIGGAGDIIYAIPAMYELAKGRKINLYLSLHQPLKNFTKKMQYPNGKVILNEKSLEFFRPLILSQKNFSSCEALTNQHIHFALDSFWRFPFDYRMGSIARWYFLTYGISRDLGKAWIEAPPDNSVSDAIVLARSSRYHAPGISYDFLSKYPRVVFVGVKDEFDEMKKSIPSLEYKPVNNFKELASVIAGGKFFIGNQSFPFSLAEAMKVKRVLEVYPFCPNVVVEGPNAYDFCYQQQFEKIVHTQYQQ